jgi:hypothetical protein
MRINDPEAIPLRTALACTSGTLRTLDGLRTKGIHPRFRFGELRLAVAYFVLRSAIRWFGAELRNSRSLQAEPAVLIPSDCHLSSDTPWMNCEGLTVASDDHPYTAKIRVRPERVIGAAS